MQVKSAAQSEISDAIDWVRWVFKHDPSPARPSSSDYFSGGVNKGGKLPLKPTSARAGRRHHATESTRTQFSKPAIDLRYEGGRHFAVINSLPEHQIALLRAVYQPASPDQFQCAIHLARHLHDEYIAGLTGSIRATTRHSIRRMVDAKVAAARDWRLAIALRSRPHELFGEEYENWKKSRAEHWRGINQLFSEMHDDAVMAVYMRDISR